MIVRGYKVFNHDWTCNPCNNKKQYTCPGKFEEDVNLSVCHHGMHFCKRAVDCFNYYTFNPENKVAEVIAYGKVVEKKDKCCTNKLEIVREIPWAELLEIVNTGKWCAGFKNSGDWNSGIYNSGNRNSGSRNSGCANSGSWNSGDWNSGNWNSGRQNSGCGNSGNWNGGDCNSGDRNIGNYNSGDWNKCNFSSGCFNTIDQKIYLFNKPSEWTYKDWVNSDAWRILNQIPTDVLTFVSSTEMTDTEELLHPEAEITGGYLKKSSSPLDRMEWWKRLSEKDKTTIKEIPNFDKGIFKEITGIDIDL